MIRKIMQVITLFLVCASFMGFLGIGTSRSVNDIIKLLKTNVGEEVIRTHISQSGMTFELSTKDIINLKKAGASDDLLSFMMGNNSSSEFPFEIEKDFLVKKPVVHNHLAIYPVFRKVNANAAHYLTLDEAQEAKLIIITEKESGSVPVVIITNTGTMPVYIMAGEIIIGGRQDRMVSHDVLIPAGKQINVSVRCVEHGRWQGKSYEFKSGGAVGSRDIRSALQFKDQQEVWDQVSKKCKEHNAESQSGTYRAVASSKNVELKSKPYLDAMKHGLVDEDVVGMIVAINGEVVCVDIFLSPKFFKKIKEKLLKSYVLDAISTEITSTSYATKNDILDFFKELKVAKIEQSKKYQANCNFELESDRLIGNESKDDEGNLQHLNLYTH